MTWRTVIPMRYSGLGSNRTYTIVGACSSRTGSRHRLRSFLSSVGRIFRRRFVGIMRSSLDGSSLKAQRRSFQAPRSSLAAEGQNRSAGDMNFTSGGSYSRRALFLSLFSTLSAVGLNGISSGGERYFTTLAPSPSQFVVISRSLIYSSQVSK